MKDNHSVCITTNTWQRENIKDDSNKGNDLFLSLRSLYSSPPLLRISEHGLIGMSPTQYERFGTCREVVPIQMLATIFLKINTDTNIFNLSKAVLRLFLIQQWKHLMQYSNLHSSGETHQPITILEEAYVVPEG